MNPLSKPIISVCAQRDWSWHHLSCWAIDGLSHSVIKYCPCSSTELSKHNRAFGGSGIPLSLLGLFKHSRCVCSAERAAQWQEPGLPGATRTPQQQDQRTRGSSPGTDHTWAGRHSHHNEYKSEARMLFPGGILKPSSHRELSLLQMHGVSPQISFQDQKPRVFLNETEFL